MRNLTRSSRLLAGLAALAGVMASHAQAISPFYAITFDAGGGVPGSLGEGFRTSGAGFYNRQGATNVDLDSSDPTTWLETNANHVPYDSYFALSGGGPSRSITADTGDSLTPQINDFYDDFGVAYANEYFDASGNGIQVFLPGSHIGGTGDNDGMAPYPDGTIVNEARAALGVAPPPVTSGPSPLGLGVFIGQLTVNRGAVLSGGLLFTALIGSVPMGDFEAHNLVLNGPEVLFQTDVGVFQPLVLRSYLVGGNADLSHSRSGGNISVTGGQRFGAADVYHLWVEVVPAPSPVAFMAFAVLTASRRRR